jgi:hypothetical protein
VLFGPYLSEREVKVLEYVIHRLGDGARLEDIVQEQYVLRYASPGRSKTSWTIPGSSRPSERRWRRTFLPESST